MIHVVMFSGGLGSWGTARRVAERHGTTDLVLLFADTLIEDPDLYRFLDEAAADLGVPVTRVVEGRTPWQVFNDVKLIGNTRADPCSRVLKREPLRRWLETECDPASTIVYLGFDWTEQHRIDRAAAFWSPWRVESPLADGPPYLVREELMAEARAAGIEPPRLYELGFPHNNCGGFCVKAGHANFKLLLEKFPERFAEHEAAESAFNARFREGKAPVAILRDRTKGQTRPLSLHELRMRVEAGGAQIDPLDWGGCDCFTPPDTETTD